MTRRRPAQSGIDQALERYGVSPSGGSIGVLSFKEFELGRKLQRIGTKDPTSRRKFDRRSRRVEAQLLNEHAFVHGQRFGEPEFYEWYLRNPGTDALSQVERFYFKDFQNGRPLSFVVEDLRSFRKTDKAFAKHFSPEEIDHIARHLTIKALRDAKLGAS